MKIFNNINDLKQLRGPRSTCLTIGNFDGCHIGHRALITSVVERAHNLDCLPTVLTFDPHPAEALGIVDKVPRIQTLADRLSSLEALGVQCAVVLEFSRSLSELPAKLFVESLLCGAAGMRFIAVGGDFRFGHKRTGDVELLKSMGEEGNRFDVTAVPPVLVRGEIASSTKIRLCLAEEGNLVLANDILGRPWTFSGTVIEGDRIGRTIGFPTANLSGVETLIPKHGVYAARVSSRNESLLRAPAVMNIGTRPTIRGRDLRVEVHVLDRVDLDLYGKNLTVEPVKYLRQEIKFAGRDELMTQIAADCLASRKVI